MTALLCALLLQAQPDLGRVVPFDEPAAVLSQLLPKLGEKAGLKFALTTAMPDVGIYVHSKDMTTKEIMDGIANRTFGEWNVESGIYYLRPSRNKLAAVNSLKEQKLLNRIRKQWVAWEKQAGRAELSGSDVLRFRHLSEQFQERGETEAPPQPTPAQQKEFEDMNRADPRQGFGIRVLLTLSPEAIARCGPNQRIVYSTDPTIMQGGLSWQAIRPILDRQQRETRLWDRVMNVDPDEAPAPGDPPVVEAPAAKPQVAGRVQVAILRQSEMGDNLSITTTVFDTDGHMMDSSQQYVEAVDRENLAKEAEKPAAGADLHAGEMVVFSPLTREFNKALMSSVAKGNEIDPTQLKQFLNLDKYDPLKLGATDLLRAIADYRCGGNSVSNAPDLLSLLTMMNGEQGLDKMPLGFIDHNMGGSETAVVGNRGGGLQLTDPALVSSMSASRVAMKALFDELAQTGTCSTENLARYSLGLHGQAAFMDYGLIMASLIRRQALFAGDDSVMMGNVDLLKTFYNSLSTLEQGILKSGKSLNIATLGPKPLGALHNALYLAIGQLQVVHPKNPDADALSEAAQRSREMTEPDGPGDLGAAGMETGMYGSGNLAEGIQEPTFSFPTPPTTGAIVPTIVQDRVYLVKQKVGKPGMDVEYYVPAEQVAQMVYMQNHPEIAGNSEWSGRAMAIQAFSRTQLKFRVILTPMLYMESIVPQTKTPLHKSPVAYKDLPAEFKAEIDKKLEDVAKMYKDFTPGQEVAPAQKPQTKPPTNS